MAQVLDQGMPAGDTVGGCGLLKATHGPQPLFEVAMIPLNTVIQIA